MCSLSISKARAVLSPGLSPGSEPLSVPPLPWRPLPPPACPTILSLLAASHYCPTPHTRLHTPHAQSSSSTLWKCLHFCELLTPKWKFSANVQQPPCSSAHALSAKYEELSFALGITRKKMS